MKVSYDMPQYKIEVLLFPDQYSGFYFWCLLALSGTRWCNSGQGWAETPEKAWNDARAYQRRVFSPNI